MKKYLAFILVMLLAVTVVVPVTRTTGQNITTVKIYIGKPTAYINDAEETLDQPPVIMNNRTMVPIRFVSEAMGANVQWNGVERTVTITLGKNLAVLKIDDVKAKANGYDVYLDAAPTIIVKTSRTVVPIRFVAETLGMEVTWNGAERSVTITYSPDWEPITVTFWNAMAYKQGETLHNLVEEFNATHPRINVKNVDFANYSALQQKTIAAIAAGEPPVLAQAYESWTAQYLTGGYLVPTEKFVKGPDGLLKSTVKDYFNIMWKDGYLPDGKMWMFPFNKSDMVIYYNPGMLKANGISGPPKTWVEFENDCKILTKADGSQWGASYTPLSYLWYARVYEYGGEVLSKDFRKVLFDKIPGALEATKAMSDMVRNGYIHITSGYSYEADFSNERCAFIFSTIAGLYYIKKAVGDKFAFAEASLPAGPVSQHSIMFGTNIVIFGTKSTIPQQEAAWKFVKWFTEPRQTAEWAIGTGYLPVRKSSLELPFMKKYISEHPELKAGYDQLPTCIVVPPIAVWNQSIRDITAELQKIYLGKASPEDGIKELAVKIRANIGEK